jgi:hypothetical protein
MVSDPGVQEAGHPSPSCESAHWKVYMYVYVYVYVYIYVYVCVCVRGVRIRYIGVVSVVIQHNCVYYCDTCHI